MVPTLRLIALGAVCLLALFPISYWAKGVEVGGLDAEARANLLRRGLAHQFATLPSGVVHYRLEGPSDGATIVLIHGFAGAMFVWDAVIPKLTAAGYRVLAFDGYGRGFSSRPEAVYDENLMDTQVVELLDHLAIRGKAHLVGYSAGGVSAIVFTDRHPERVASLSLIAPGGLAASRPLPAWLFKIPGLRSWFGRVVAPGLFQGFFGKTLVRLPDAEQLKALAGQQFQYRGAGEALTSMTLDYPITGAEACYGALNRTEVPVFLLWGQADTTAPFHLSEKARQLVPRAEFRSLPHTEHNLPYAQPDLAARQILSFIRRSSVSEGGVHPPALAPSGDIL